MQESAAGLPAPRTRSSVKSVVFVLDEFDLFAAKRSKQTLLYNLLDALQTSGMQARRGRLAGPG